MLSALLNSIVTVGLGDKFYRFTNADAKTWVVPANNISIAMCLYQPSGIKGKLLKSLFPLLHNIPMTAKCVHADIIRCQLNHTLLNIIQRAFNVQKPEFALFCGTPSVHQKFTFQIFKNNTILGYCKVTDNVEVYNLFKHEESVLKYLVDCGIKDVPSVLFCDKISNDCFAFVQSTVKTPTSRVEHKWTGLQQDFIVSFDKNTRKDILFEESDFYKDIMELRSHLSWLPTTINADVVRSTIDGVVNRFSGKVVSFSASHGDFTPWNMFVERGSLFVFDWEYAKFTCPPLLDRYHFFSQSAFFEKHWQPRQVVEYANSPQGKWIDKEQYMLYLLHILSRYTMRSNGSIPENEIQLFEFWNALLKYFSPASL